MNAPNFRPDRCPSCGYAVDSVTPLGSEKESRPKHGDFSVCLNCGHLGVFDVNLNLATASLDDEAHLSPESFAQVRKAQRIIQQRGLIA